jgi:hypothetical protein
LSLSIAAAISDICRSSQALLRELQNGEYLRAGHSREPAQKIVNGCSFLEILEKSLYRNSRAFEQPRTTHLVPVPLNSGTVIPIQHPLEIVYVTQRRHGTKEKREAGKK